MPATLYAALGTQPQEDAAVVGLDALPSCPEHPTTVIYGWPERSSLATTNLLPPEYSWEATCHRIRVLEDADYPAYLQACAQSVAAYRIVSIGREIPAALCQTQVERVATDHYEQRVGVEKPLAGWDVIVPRAARQAASMMQMLAAEGAHPWAVPTIAVQHRNPAPQYPTNSYQWAIATSVNTVQAVDEERARQLRWAAVGAKTAAALQQRGCEVSLTPPQSAQTAEGLLAAFPRPEHPMPDASSSEASTAQTPRVWYPRADIATPTLAAGLRAQGWEVEEATAYCTTTAPGVPAGFIHWMASTANQVTSAARVVLVVTSGSTIRNFTKLCGQPPHCWRLAAIGPKARAVAEGLGYAVDIEPAVSQADALVAAIAASAAQP
ncbi:MAG: uroporphyrinogen-III synthase [Corynebacterium sp.]|nr:uroporphyrinogen-III synthase [Corynebacterium sp.]